MDVLVLLMTPPLVVGWVLAVRYRRLWRAAEARAVRVWQTAAERRANRKCAGVPPQAWAESYSADEQEGE